MIRWVNLGLILLCVCGCLTAPPKSYFQINMSAANTDLGKRDKILLVEPAKVEGMYRDYRIVYRKSAWEFNYYPHDFWTDKPGRMVQNAIFNYLEEGKWFKRVLRDVPQGDLDWVLRSTILAIEEMDEAATWSAHLAMSLELVEFKTGKVMARHRFDRSEKLSEQKVKHLPRVMSKILREELNHLLQKNF